MLSEEAYSSLRHYETIVLVDSRSAVKKHRVLALSEDRIHILIHKNYRKEIDAPWLLKEITRIERLDKIAADIFTNKRLNRCTQHLKITHRDPEVGFLEFYTWEEESKLFWHLNRAYENHAIRFAQNVPVSIQMEVHRSDCRGLYNELEEEILQTKVHGNPHQAQKCAELLLEVQEALLHDRRIKELFFDSGKMLRFVLKHLAHLQANDTDLSRASQLKLVYAMLSVIHAALFNSETLDKRLNLLVPRPYTFGGLVEIFTLDYRKSAATKASRVLQEQKKQHQLKVLSKQAESEIQKHTERPEDHVGNVIRRSLKSTAGHLNLMMSSVRSSGGTTVSPHQSPTRTIGGGSSVLNHMSHEEYYDDHGSFLNLMKQVSKRDIDASDSENGSNDENTYGPTGGVDSETGHQHTHISPGRVHRSNSMMHIWSHGPRRASAVNVPPTWSEAKSKGLNVSNRDLANLLTTPERAGGPRQVSSPTSHELDSNGNRLNRMGSMLGNALMMTAPRWEQAKTRVAEREALIFQQQYSHEEMYPSDEEYGGVGTREQERDRIMRQMAHDSDSDSDLDLEDERDDEDVKEHNYFIRKIDTLQVLIVNQIKLLVEHGVNHKSGHVYESFGETVANIPLWTKNRLSCYVNRFKELITHQEEDGHPRATFSWLVYEHVKLLNNLSITSYKFREKLRQHCMEEIKFFFCSRSFVDNIPPKTLFNSFSLSDLDEALVWILHSDDHAGDKEKIMEKQKEGDMEWDIKSLLEETGDEEYKNGPYCLVLKSHTRKNDVFSIYYKGENIHGAHYDESSGSSEEEDSDEEADIGIRVPKNRRMFDSSDSDESSDDDSRSRSRKQRRKEKMLRERERKKNRGGGSGKRRSRR